MKKCIKKSRTQSHIFKYKLNFQDRHYNFFHLFIYSYIYSFIYRQYIMPDDCRSMKVQVA